MSSTEEMDDFCQLWFPKLVGMLSLYCGNSLVAEDMAQETLIRICRDWGRVKRMDHSDAWVRQVALNLARSHYRRLKAERRAKARLEVYPEHRVSPVSDSALVVRAAISELPHREKAALVLRFYEDLTVPEVARHLDLPEGTVKSLIHRGAQRLRLKLKDFETERENSDAR